MNAENLIEIAFTVPEEMGDESHQCVCFCSTFAVRVGNPFPFLNLTSHGSMIRALRGDCNAANRADVSQSTAEISALKDFEGISFRSAPEPGRNGQAGPTKRDAGGEPLR